MLANLVQWLDGWQFKALMALGLGPKTTANSWLNNKQALLVREAMQKRQFTTLVSRLDQTLNETPELYALMIAAISEFDTPELVDDFLARFADSQHAHLAVAAQRIHWAWLARTGVGAGGVSRSGWQLFEQRLAQADRHLQKVAQLNPNNVVLYSHWITCGMGQGLEFEPLLQRFETMLAVDPKHVDGYCNFLYAQCEKWGGSHEQMFDFARHFAEHAPDGSPLAVLVAQAHVEYWAYLNQFEGNAVAAQVHITSEAVQQELRQAFARSLKHPHYQKTAQHPHYAGYFACAFYLAGDYSNARWCVAQLIRGCNQYPWHYLAQYYLEGLNAGYVVGRVLKEVKP